MSGYTWLDGTVIRAIEYFVSMLVYFGDRAKKISVCLSTLLIILTALKLAWSRVSIKDAVFGILSKHFVLVALFTLYSSAVMFIPSIANALGRHAGGGEEYLKASLTSLRDALRSSTGEYESNMLSGAEKLENAANLLKMDLPEWDRTQSGYDSYWSQVAIRASELVNEATNGIDYSTGSYSSFGNGVTARDAYEAQRLANEARMTGMDDTMYAIQMSRLKSLSSILIEKSVEKKDENGNSLVESYVSIDLYMKDPKTKRDMIWLSPETMLRMGTFICEFLFSKPDEYRQIALVDLGEAKSTAKAAEKIVGIDTKKMMIGIGIQLKWLLDKFFMLLLSIGLMLALIFAMIQYVMTLIEFYIIIAIGAFLLPFTLLDATKEVTKKLVPVLMGFFFKILIMVICLFFAYWMLINYTNEIISDFGGINFSCMFKGAFIAILVFIMTQNAPQIAQTLLTGNPQLSMGEFMAAAGTAAAVAGTTFAAGKTAIRGGINGATNTAGTLKKATAAADMASDLTASGEMKGSPLGNSLKAFSSSIGGDIKAGAKQNAAKFLRGGGELAGSPLGRLAGMAGFGGGGGRGSDSGSFAYTPSGTTVAHGGGGGSQTADGSEKNNQVPNPQVIVPLSATSNPRFQDAKIFDAERNTQRDMTHREYFQEKKMQGEAVARAMADRQKAKSPPPPHPPVYNSNTVESLESANIPPQQISHDDTLPPALI